MTSSWSFIRQLLQWCTVQLTLDSVNIAYFQRRIQLSGFSAYPDGSPSQLFRISGVLLYLSFALSILWRNMRRCFSVRIFFTATPSSPSSSHSSIPYQNFLSPDSVLLSGHHHRSLLIYLLTAIGLTPGGSSTVHIYTQTVHRTTQLTTLVGKAFWDSDPEWSN